MPETFETGKTFKKSNCSETSNFKQRLMERGSETQGASEAVISVLSVVMSLAAPGSLFEQEGKSPGEARGREVPVWKVWECSNEAETVLGRAALSCPVKAVSY